MPPYNPHNQRGKNQNRERREEPPPPDNQIQSEWLTNRITEAAIAHAEKVGSYLAATGFTTSQFRNFYGELKRIQLNGIEQNTSAFLLLRPKLAYAVARSSSGRNKPKGSEFFRDLITSGMRIVAPDNDGSETRFKNFCDYTEAVLAFHKAAGGRDQ